MTLDKVNTHYSADGRLTLGYITSNRLERVNNPHRSIGARGTIWTLHRVLSRLPQAVNQAARVDSCLMSLPLVLGKTDVPVQQQVYSANRHVTHHMTSYLRSFQGQSGALLVQEMTACAGVCQTRSHFSHFVTYLHTWHTYRRNTGIIMLFLFFQAPLTLIKSWNKSLAKMGNSSTHLFLFTVNMAMKT